jgi:hypothetical protein
MTQPRDRLSRVRPLEWDLVDLVGFEPTTSSIPYNSKNRILLMAKALKSRTSRQEPLKPARFSTKMLAKRVLSNATNLIRAKG